MSGPALGVISQAIKLWLKSVCSQLEQLDLKLQGSLWRLLQGHLSGATVRAQGVVFQDLAIEQVELSSEPIDLEVGGLLKGQPLQLVEGCGHLPHLDQPELVASTWIGP